VEHSQLTYSGVRAGGTRADIRAAVGSATLESRAFLAAVLLQVLAALLMCTIARRPVFVGLADSYSTFGGAGAIIGLMTFTMVLFRRRETLGTSQATLENYRIAWSSCRDSLSAEYVANVAIVFLVAPIGLSAFSGAKQAIPFIHPFSWDERIASLGAAINGGTHLWVLLQPILSHPAVTVAMDWFYHRFWAVLVLSAFAFGALLPPSPLRRQYLLAFVLVFVVVGTAGALALSSAGPAYYARVVRSSSPDPYGPLLNYLQSVNARDGLLAIRGQRGLWYAYTHDVEALGFGVSAMPSVHVASVTLVALFGFAISRMIGVLLAMIAICTFVASVALAWHYALDGYVAALLAGCIWWFAGRVTVEPGQAER
jgi:hypothetical protein